MGGAAGAAAFIPGEGVPAGLVASAIQVPAFFEASALFALSVAEVHGVAVDDLERRRTLILAILLGDSGARVVEQAAGRTGKHWGRWVVSKISRDQILRVNKVPRAELHHEAGDEAGDLGSRSGDSAGHWHCDRGGRKRDDWQGLRECRP